MSVSLKAPPSWGPSGRSSAWGVPTRRATSPPLYWSAVWCMILVWRS
jgi:hypothetical protein